MVEPDRKHWGRRLKEHYSATLAQSFRQFKLGAMLFFLGGVLIYISVSAIQPSTSQELMLLTGLIIGGMGFLIAMMAQIRMLISRLVKFFFE
ncbi:hypothetical protein [Pseudomaricurvus sp.]|uniref:hypothetical protein n=1 Tax=Pseudomaricurvus sp. TaxID=2004510 RepID=UPI003F6C01FB